MPYKLTRPAADFDSGSGLLLLEHFQMAYVTNDMNKARKMLRDRLGIQAFARLEGELSGGGYIEAEFAWVGTLMYEVICARGAGSEIYNNRLPNVEGFMMKHHHLGFLIQNQAQWDAVQTNAKDKGWEMAAHSNNPLVEVCFVDAPELGHYLEYLFATPEGIAFFENVPRH